MKINIQSPGCTIKADFSGYVHENVENLSRFYSEIITGEVSQARKFSHERK